MVLAKRSAPETDNPTSIKWLLSHIFHSSAGRNHYRDFTEAAAILSVQSIPLAGRLTRRFNGYSGVYGFIGAAIDYRGAAGFHVFGTIFRMEGIGKDVLLNGFHERQLGKVPFRRKANKKELCALVSQHSSITAFCVQPRDCALLIRAVHKTPAVPDCRASHFSHNIQLLQRQSVPDTVHCSFSMLS